MAATKRQGSPDETIFVIQAVFCEKLLVEQDGTLSLIRMIDRLTRTAPSQGEAPGQATYRMFFLVTLKSGGFTGRVPVTIFHEFPNGKQKNLVETSVEFAEVTRGANLTLDIMNFPTDSPGVHWLGVKIDNRIVSRSPFEVRHEGSATPTPTVK